ncbi:hypothetical protein ASF60_12615 [Methylobacterium sp. Leaf113]|uniref:FitA-like ribbon-helix-helix domain-containing protein n=1 Tax=Methylobacterium sp. Leaf113 TaxID=1736259 RepID=UPI0006F2DA16|nr:hypothetical protein [Methylobacterium sp. Leaf113]KQP94295.1 hypothetical protein ASF60_12615 [Methylobacterium sp. Leaf113]
MGELMIRNVDDETVQQISSRARRHGRSIEHEVLTLLRDGLAAERAVVLQDRVARVARIAAMVPKSIMQTDSVDLIREDRDR